jgi:hypothetical protein
VLRRSQRPIFDAGGGVLAFGASSPATTEPQSTALAEDLAARDLTTKLRQPE